GVLQQHELDLAAGVFAHRLDGLIGGDACGRHAIEDRRRGRALHAECFQLFDVLLNRGRVASGPAGDHRLVDGDIGPPWARGIMQRKSENHASSRENADEGARLAGDQAGAKLLFPWRTHSRQPKETIMRSIAATTKGLEAGAKSRDVVEQCLAHIEDRSGEGARTFLKVHGEAARAAADYYDRLRARGAAPSPYAGIPVSIKDLFDIAGDVTTAGSTALRETPPAKHDAPSVARLRAAGFIPIGRTNMTEFAFSGLGINTHYDTPRNPYARPAARIP